MKKNHLVAGLIGVVLLTGSTVSIAAAGIHKGWDNSKSGIDEVDSGYLHGVSQGDTWAALQLLLNPLATQSLPTTLDTTATAILPVDTATATIQLDDSDSAINGDDSDSAINGDDSDSAINGDDSDSIIGIPSLSPLTTTPTIPTGITNPFTSKSDNSKHAEEPSDNSDD